MFDKKQESCIKRFHLVNDDGLYDVKSFYDVKNVFYSSSMYRYVLTISQNWHLFINFVIRDSIFDLGLC